eukprot:851770-Alexandrium_andersonii.AAC.1
MALLQAAPCYGVLSCCCRHGSMLAEKARLLPSVPPVSQRSRGLRRRAGTDCGNRAGGRCKAVMGASPAVHW